MSKRKKPPLRQLKTAIDVIDLLGGNADVADMLGAKPTAVSNWRYFDKFPADTFFVLKHELRRRGYDAPVTLWKMIVPRKSARAASRP